MKSYLTVLSVLLAATSVSASNGQLVCDWIDSNGYQSFLDTVDLGHDYDHAFSDLGFPEVRYDVSYSSILKTVDSSILDQALGISAYSTEWSNASAIGAHSAVRLATSKGSFTLSCSMHEAAIGEKAAANR